VLRFVAERGVVGKGKVEMTTADALSDFFTLCKWFLVQPAFHIVDPTVGTGRGEGEGVAAGNGFKKSEHGRIGDVGFLYTRYF
jgi:hypothetical protein